MIDIHTHLWPGKESEPYLIEYLKGKSIWDKSFKALKAEGLLNRMDYNNIKISIVSSVALKLNLNNEDLSKINIYVSKEVKKAKDRLIGFCTVDPYGNNDSINLLKICINDLDFKGLKLHTSIQQFYPSDKKLYPIYEEMQKLGLPILFHTGSISGALFKDTYSNPKYIDDVACDFPNLIIIMGHAGRIWFDEAVMMMRKHKNVYADISTNIGKCEEFNSTPLEWFLYKVKVWVGNFDRVLFGSDYPFYFQDSIIEALNIAAMKLNRDFPNFISHEDLKKIKYYNAKNILKL